jgi:hypothetical protein
MQLQRGHRLRIPAGDLLSSRGQRPISVNLSALVTLEVASAQEIAALSLGERVPDEGGRVRGRFSPLTLLVSLPLRAAELSNALGGDARDEVTPHPAAQGRHPLPSGEGWFLLRRGAANPIRYVNV